MMTTRSQTSSTSLRRCEFKSTETPRPRSSSRSARTVRRPAGSSALVGSSRTRNRGAPIIAWAIPSRCCMPFDIWSTLRSPTSARPTSSSSRPRSAGAAVRSDQALVQAHHLVGPQPPGEAEELGQVAERPPGVARARRRPEHRRPPAARADEAAADLDERRLAGAVRAEQPDQLALAHLKAHAVERADPAVPLLEPLSGERVRHGARVYRRAPRRPPPPP